MPDPFVFLKSCCWPLKIFYTVTFLVKWKKLIKPQISVSFVHTKIVFLVVFFITTSYKLCLAGLGVISLPNHSKKGILPFKISRQTYFPSALFSQKGNIGKNKAEKPWLSLPNSHSLLSMLWQTASSPSFFSMPISFHFCCCTCKTAYLPALTSVGFVLFASLYHIFPQ